MKLPIALLSVVLTPTLAATHHPIKRALCTVHSRNSSLLDDSPAINTAIATCGATGSIILPVNQTFTLHSPVNLSPCRACELRINGLVNVAPDLRYWSTQNAVFNIANTTAALVLSDEPYTGVIDAQRLGFDGNIYPPLFIPPLFKIDAESYQIHIRSLVIKNVPDTAVLVTGNSSAIRFYDLSFPGYHDSDRIAGPRTTFQVEGGAQHVYVWNNTMRTTSAGACVRIRPNASNVQVEESSCTTNDQDTAPAAGPSGFDLLFDSVGWIKNVFVLNVKAVGGLYVVKFEAYESPIQISNATFEDVTIAGPEPARAAVVLDQANSSVDATDVVLAGFTGKAAEEKSITCAKDGDVCGFTIEDWSVVYGR